MPFHSRGFTLIELMVVVVIIAILAAIAIPSYRRYAMRAHRADAQNLLMHIATAEERYYSTNNQYTDDLTQFGYAAKSNVPSEHDYYTAAVAVQNKNQQFTATATPQNGQADDKCGAMSIDNTGTKLPARTDASANSNGHCW